MGGGVDFVCVLGGGKSGGGWWWKWKWLVQCVHGSEVSQ